jgi:HlyD family secretion protein
VLFRSHDFEATGSVEAPQNVKIAPKVSGRIDYLSLHEGDAVKKGQVLVRIDPSEVEGEVQQAQASLAEAQYRLAQAQLSQGPSDVAVSTQVRQQHASVTSANADYEQTVQNSQSQVASAESMVTDAQAKIDNAKASVKSAQANLDNATTKYNRMAGLFAKGFVAAQDVDDAKATVSVQQSAVDVAIGLLASATAQKASVDQQLKIAKAKGKADVAASRARRDQAEASLDYAKANTAQKPAYQQSLAALRSSVSAARATLRSAQARRQDTVLTSPLDGYVTGRYADQGAMATPGQAILAVQFIKQVWVSVSAPEEVSTKLHLGQPATIKLDAFAGQTFTGNVIQINPSADPQSRQFMVRVILSNTGNLLKPGMFGRVTFETDRINHSVAVPREAVQQDTFGSYVMLVDKAGKAKRQSVTPGLDDTSFISIEQGVRPGDKVITMSAFPVRDGQAVKVGGAKRGHGKRDGAAR